MKLVVQVVEDASVIIDNKIYSKIDKGFLVYAGFNNKDSLETVKKGCEKLLKLRIFSDSDGKMNLNLEQVKGKILLVSQFTLYASVEKSNRPSFVGSLGYSDALKLYDYLVSLLKKSTYEIQTGKFGADMKIKSTNIGPTTILYESE